jgi:hypothetical protein
MKKFAMFFAAILLAGCSGNHLDYLRMHNIPPPTPENFLHCYNYGCQKRFLVTLPETTQTRLHKLFTPSPKAAEEERSRIAKAIQIFEQDIGALTGTENDKVGTFELYLTDGAETQQFQQDCIDESTNTTIYLTLLYDMGYLAFHHPMNAATRQPFLSGGAWWHQTAVIKDEQTGEKYAVDSWFKDNGYPAAVVPLKKWKKGWRPSKSKENR